MAFIDFRAPALTNKCYFDILSCRRASVILMFNCTTTRVKRMSLGKNSRAPASVGPCTRNEPPANILFRDSYDLTQRFGTGADRDGLVRDSFTSAKAFGVVYLNLHTNPKQKKKKSITIYMNLNMNSNFLIL